MDSVRAPTGGGRRVCTGLAAALLGIGAAACGEEEKSEPQAGAKPERGTVLALTAVPSPGKIEFDKDRLTAKAGKVTIEFTNRQQVGHNVRVQTGSKCCFRPGSRDIGGTPTITKGKASATLDLKPGKYSFLCSLGGHWQRGQRGTLVVR